MFMTVCSVLVKAGDIRLGRLICSKEASGDAAVEFEVGDPKPPYEFGVDGKLDIELELGVAPATEDSSLPAFFLREGIAIAIDEDIVLR